MMADTPVKQKKLSLLHGRGWCETDLKIGEKGACL